MDDVKQRSYMNYYRARESGASKQKDLYVRSNMGQPIPKELRRTHYEYDPIRYRRKRKVKKPTRRNRTRRYREARDRRFSLRNRVIKVLAGAAIASATIMGATATVKGCTALFKSKDVTIVEANGSGNNDVLIFDDDGNIIETIPDDTLMFHDGKIKGNDEDITIYTTDNEGNTIEGRVKVTDYDEIGVIPKKDLETYTHMYEVVGDAGYIRKSPKIEGNIVGKLENGDYVLGTEIDENDWAQAFLISDGEIIKGHISGDEIRELEQSENVTEIINNKTTVAEKRMVTGIDVSYITPENLRQIVQSPNAIPTTVNGNYIENLDVGDIAGNIDYVMIRIGASGYGDTFSIVKDDEQDENLIGCVRVLEECEVPYGFYYYSTANNEDEMYEEYAYIKSMLDRMGTNRRYNRMPFAIDREQSRYMDEETGEIVEASRVNGIDATGILAKQYELYSNLFNDVYLYMGAEDIGEGGIINLDEFERLTGSPAELWFPATRLEDGSLSWYTNMKLDSIGENARNIVMTQTVINASLKDGYDYNDSIIVDLNTMDRNDFDRAIRGKKIRESSKKRYIEEDEIER